MLTPAYFTPSYFGAFVLSGELSEDAAVARLVCGSIGISAAVQALFLVRASVDGETGTRPALGGSARLGKCE